MVLKLIIHRLSKTLPQVIKTEGEDILTYLHFKGGDRLKFGDLVMVVATIAVVYALIAAPLQWVLFSAVGISAMNNWGYITILIVTVFLSTLINGYIFAGKIWEARRESITKIAVLWAALMMLFAVIVPASNAYWGLAVREDFEAMYPDAPEPSTAEWLTYNWMFLDLFTCIMVGIELVTAFVGLYVGSMLKRPAKS